MSAELRDVEVTVSYLRDGQERTSTATVGERLTAAGADGVRGLIAGDRILEVEGLDIDGPPSYDRVAAHVGGRLGHPLDVIVLDGRTGDEIGVEGAVFTEIIDTDAAVSGFFGVSPFYSRRGLGAATAAAESVRIIPQLVKEVVRAIPAIFYEGVADTVASIFSTADDASHEAGPAAQDELEARRLDTAVPDADRVISIYGVARIGVEAVAVEGFLSLLVVMVFVNIFIGVFNLLPLLPLDGGHVMVATYERIRSLGGGSHRVDATRLLPFTYAVLAVLLLIGLVALVRDIVDPVRWFG